MEYSEEFISNLYDTHLEAKFKKRLTNHQLQALTNIANNKDTLCALPTGAGKSLIFMVAPLMMYQVKKRHQFAVVVMPLISLIESFKQQLQRERSVLSVGVVHSEVADLDTIYDTLMWEVYDVLLITPEAVMDKRWEGLLTSPSVKERICCIVWDEAHCVATWGKEFRPAYVNSSRLRPRIGAVAVLLTATCDEAIKKDLMTIFALEFDVVAALPDREPVIKPSNRDLIKGSKDKWHNWSG